MATLQLRTTLKKGNATLKTRVQIGNYRFWLDSHIVVDIEKYTKAQESHRKAVAYYATDEGKKVASLGNLFLYELGNALREGITDIKEFDRHLTAILYPEKAKSKKRKLKERIERRHNRLNSLLEYYDFFLDGISKGNILHHQGKLYSKGSITIWIRFGKYLRENLKNDYEITFDDITKSFSDSFTAFLMRKDLMPKTINLQRQTMRKMCNSAAEEGINSNGVSLKVWKETTVKAQEMKAEVYMTEEELDALHDMPLLGEDAQVRDLFLLGYFSCQRISDYAHLGRSNFKYDEETGLMLFSITQKKTGTYVEVPITDNRVGHICARYNYDFPKIDKRTINRRIKGILKDLSSSVPSLAELIVTRLTYIERRSEKNYEDLCRKVARSGVKSLDANQKNEYYKLKLYAKGHQGSPLFQRDNAGQVIRPKYELISSHTARRSGVTNMYKLGILDTREMMSISGHQSEKVFEHYIKVGVREQARRTAAKLMAASKEPERSGRVV